MSTGKRKPRVVLADDEFHMRAFIGALLGTMGVDVVGQAANGQDAVRLFREHRPDLILLDINMPIATGLEALAEIRKAYPSAVAVMLTSVADADSVRACLELGAANYLRKDSPIAEIKRVIGDVLGITEGRHEGKV